MSMIIICSVCLRELYHFNGTYREICMRIAWYGAPMMVFSSRAFYWKNSEKFNQSKRDFSSEDEYIQPTDDRQTTLNESTEQWEP